MAIARLEPTLGGTTLPKSFTGLDNFGRRNETAPQPPPAKPVVGCRRLLCISSRDHLIRWRHERLCPIFPASWRFSSRGNA